MHHTMRRAASAGTIGVAAAAAIVLSATSAQAVSWYSWVPPKATDVINVADKDLGDGTTRLQIRHGKLNGTVYLWGRVAYPASKYNSDHNLTFKVSGDCMNGSSKITVDIDTTTYTSATKRDLLCTYNAQIVKKSTGKVIASVVYS
jgi:hypothetical protein